VQNTLMEFSGGPDGVQLVEFSESFPVNYSTLYSRQDHFFAPEQHRQWRMRVRTVTWVEYGTIDPSYRKGIILYPGTSRMGSHPSTPWGNAHGRTELATIPPLTEFIRREVILQWDSKGNLLEPIEIILAQNWPFSELAVPLETVVNASAATEVTESTTSETIPIAGGLPVTPGQVNRLIEHFEPEPEQDEAMQPLEPYDSVESRQQYNQDRAEYSDYIRQVEQVSLETLKLDAERRTAAEQAACDRDLCQAQEESLAEHMQRLEMQQLKEQAELDRALRYSNLAHAFEQMTWAKRECRPHGKTQICSRVYAECSRKATTPSPAVVSEILQDLHHELDADTPTTGVFNDLFSDTLPTDACSAHDLKLFLERDFATVVDSLDTDDPAAAAAAAAATDTTQLPPPPPPPLQQTSSVEKLSTDFVNSKIENPRSTAATLDCHLEDDNPDGWLTPIPHTPSDEKIALINKLLTENPGMPIDVAHILADDALDGEPNLAQSFAAQQQSLQLSEFANSIDTPPLSLPQHDSSAPTVLKLRMMLDTGNSPISICSNALNTLLKKATPSKTKFTGAFGSELTGADRTGTLPMSILGKHSNATCSLDLTVNTIENVNIDLMSFYQMFKVGWNLHITDERAEMTHRHTGQVIPLFLCPRTRAWYIIYYLPTSAVTAEKSDEAFTAFVSNGCHVTSAHTLIDEYVPATECTEILTHGVLNRTVDLLRDEDSIHIVYFHDGILHDCNDGSNCGIAANLSAVELAEIEKGVQHTLGHKASISSKHKKMTRQQHHEENGHLGHMPGCDVCEAVRRTTVRKSAEVDRYIEQRPGYLWGFDLATFSKYPGKNGELYYAVFRDVKTGYSSGFSLNLKSDLSENLAEQIEALRAEYGPDWSHMICRELLLDNAGEQRDDCKIFNQRMNGLKDGACLRKYSDPSRETTKATQEAAVKFFEITLKKLLLQGNLPIEDWPYAAVDAEWLMQHYPRGSDINSRDGDGIAPITALSKGRVSTAQVNNRKKNFFPFGTVCAVSSPHIKGSDLLQAARESVMYCIGRVRDLPQWKDPKTGAIVRSKDARRIEMQPGQNYRHVCNLPITCPLVTMHRPQHSLREFCVPKSGDDEQPLDPEPSMPSHLADEPVWAPSHETGKMPASKAPTLVSQVNDDESLPSSFEQLELLTTDPESFISRTVYKRFDDFGVCRGKVNCFKSELDVPGKTPWGILWDDGETSGFDRKTMMLYCVEHIDGTQVTQVLPSGESDSTCDDTVEPTTADLAIARFDKASIDYVVTEDNATWADVCKLLNLTSSDDGTAYFSWLSKVHGYGYNAQPNLPHIKLVNPYGTTKTGLSQRFHAGTPFPRPGGDVWLELLQQVKMRKKKGTVNIVRSVCDSMHSLLDARQEECYTTKKGDTWTVLCNQLDIEHSDRKTYYKWLVDQYSYDSKFQIPNPYEMANGTFTIGPGVPFPRPHGDRYDSLRLEERDNSGHLALRVMHEVAQERRLFHWIHNFEESTALHNQLGLNTAISLRIEQRTTREAEQGFPGLPQTVVSDAEVAEAMDRILEWKDLPAPKNWADAMSRPDAVLWRRAGNKELTIFDELGAMSHGHTDEQLDSWNLPKKAVPLIFVFKVKWLPGTASTAANPTSADGGGPAAVVERSKAAALALYDKHKLRCCLQGHPGYMIAHVHFNPDETYASSPAAPMMRLIMSIAFLLGWHNLVFDIRSAYLQASKDKCRRIRLRYPKGFQLPLANGCERLAVLESSLYGSPASAAAWQSTLFEWILETFNTAISPTELSTSHTVPHSEGWTARVSEVDSATFIFTHQGRLVLGIIYVDDVDLYGANTDDLEYLHDRFHQKFGVVRGNPEFMLGVRRVLTTESDGSRTLTFSMAKYINDLADEFADDSPSRTPVTPWPTDTIIGTKEEHYQPTSEDQRKYRDKGYLRLVGALLWIHRMCAPEIGFAVSQLCSVMSMPSRQAYELALGTLKWLTAHADIGIQFNDRRTTAIPDHSFGAHDLHAFYDSGHDQFNDGRAQHGNVLMLANGPVSWESRKHDVIGDSTMYNEYMAGYHAVRRVKEARNLLTEIGGAFADFIIQPTPIFGDNAAATTISRGNRPARHIELKYHYTRERVRAGDCIMLRVPTADNIADLFTKPTGGPIFRALMPHLKGLIRARAAL
jgi:hypothetical protein